MSIDAKSSRLLNQIVADSMILYDLLMSDVLRRHQLQVWFVAEHLVDTPATRA